MIPPVDLFDESSNDFDEKASLFYNTIDLTALKFDDNNDK